MQAIEDSYRLAVICPFRISGDGCPSLQEYPEGLVVGQQQGGGSEVTIIECDPDFSDRYGEANAKTECIIDCPGRHFTVGQSSTGLILTNMILSGATNSSVYVQEGGRLEVVNGIFERYACQSQKDELNTLFSTTRLTLNCLAVPFFLETWPGIQMAAQLKPNRVPMCL